MTPSELKYQVEQTGSHFFDRNSLKFFGDSMSNYGCRQTIVKTNDGEDVPVYELYRKHPVKMGLKGSAYFRKDTFKLVQNVKF
jgi:hypothetical protein